jgi:tetratricopeptide (TPR) repeat protein
MYLDTDDTVPGPEGKGVAFSLKQAHAVDGVAPAAVPDLPSHTLKDYLKSLPAGVNCVRAPYHYAIGGSEEVLEVIPRRRIVRWADGWAWYRELHEDVVPLFGNHESWQGNAGFVIEHHPSESREKKLIRNARIVQKIAGSLEKAGEAKDHRTLYNLGSIALEEGNYDRAIQFLSHAALEADFRGAKDDSLYYRQLLVRAFNMQGNYVAAVQAAFQQLATDPASPEGFLSMVDIHAKMGEWARCVTWYERLLQTPVPKDTLIDKPVERVAWPAAWAAEAYLNLQKFDQALAAAERAVKAGPVDVLALQALKVCKAAKREADALAATKLLVNYHLENGWPDAARMVLLAAPPVEEVFAREAAAVDSAISRFEDTAEIEFTQVASGDVVGTTYLEAAAPLGPRTAETDGNFTSAALRAIGEENGIVVSQDVVDGLCRLVVDPSAAYGEREITIFAPSYNEPWAPEWVRTTGIGGSEEAIVYLAEALAARGHKVIVYGPASQRTITRTLNRVEWRRLRDYDPEGEFDVLIAHRAPWAVTHNPSANQLFIWHHDHAYDPREWSVDLAMRAAHLFVSEWQRQALWGLLQAYDGPKTKDKSIDEVLHGHVIGNGVPEEQCPSFHEGIRIPNRVVYASQPIRGLSRLLSIWPEVLVAKPDAQLHLYYGKHTNQVGAAHHPAVRAELDLVERMLRGEHLKDDVDPHPPTTRDLFLASIIDHDRIPQPELMVELRKASVWAYPCIFPEVSCIAGLRAAAAGCIPVFLKKGSALGETQPNQTYAVDKLWEEGGREEFLENLVDALDDTTFNRDILRADTLMFHAWERVADRFEIAIGSGIGDHMQEANVIMSSKSVKLEGIR